MHYLVGTCRPFLHPCLGRGVRVPQKRDATLFTDPQTVTINAIANTLNRVGSGENKGTFRKDDGLVRLSYSHAYPKGSASRLAKLEHFKIASDPLMAGQSFPTGMQVHLVVKTPETGYTLTETKQVIDGFLAYLTASSGANVTKLLGGES